MPVFEQEHSSCRSLTLLAQPTQELNVGVTYSNIDGFKISSQLNIAVIGKGIFNITLDPCKVNRQ
jgi:hypothetical protein